MFRLTSTILVITLSLLAATRVDAVECGGRTCLDGEQCCADFMMGSTCFNPADHTCASSSMAAGDSGYRLCGLNEGACGSACYDKNNYFCCNGQLQQNGQACTGQTTPPTNAPTTATPVTQSPPQLNCPGANNFGGVNCSDASLCCGYGTITPSCLPADGSKKCCVHFKASTQCNQEQVCGGSGGPGASSYAACGPAGTTFCDKGTGQGTFCSQEKPTCCGYTSGFGFCCPEGCACNNNYYNCSCPSTAPVTTAPTDAPTSAPETVPATASPTQTSSTGLVCGSRTCLIGEQCCDDFMMGSTCYNPSGYTCAATTSSSGAAGSRLCGSNEGACGSVCFDQANYQCCNGQLQQKGQTCSGATNAPTSSPTSSPTSAVTQAPVMNNCPGASNFGGVNCSDASLCCGYGTITPSCLPADGSKKCCVHFKASTQCDPDQVCGGSGGPGASSYASCGAPGTTFCDKGTGQGTFCAQDKPTCCGYTSGFGFCCPEGCACNNNYYNCSCPSTAPVTTAPTDAPTSAPVTASPLPTAGPLTCGGRTCLVGDLCCNDYVIGETCYDPSGYQCAATNSASTGAPGSLLCANNQGACGSACYDKSNYYCCNNELRQNGQSCSA